MEMESSQDSLTEINSLNLMSKALHGQIDIRAYLLYNMKV